MQKISIQDIKIQHQNSFKHTKPYKDERESTWIEFLEKSKQTNKNVWNGPIFSFVSYKKNTLTIRKAEYKDIVFRIEKGEKYIEETYGESQIIKNLVVSNILITRSRRILVSIASGKSGLAEGVINFPGGNIDIGPRKGEDILELALSELKEETGISLEPLKVAPELYLLQFNYEFFLIFLWEFSHKEESVLNNQEFKKNFESKEVKFMDSNELIAKIPQECSNVVNIAKGLITHV